MPWVVFGGVLSLYEVVCSHIMCLDVSASCSVTIWRNSPAWVGGAAY